MNLKDLLIKKFKNSSTEKKSLSKKEFDELIEKEVEKRLISEIEKLDKDFIKSLSEDLPTQNKEQKAEDEEVKEVIEFLEEGAK